MDRKPTLGELDAYNQYRDRQFWGGCLKWVGGLALLIGLLVTALWVWFVGINGMVIP